MSVVPHGISKPTRGRGCSRDNGTGEPANTVDGDSLSCAANLKRVRWYVVLRTDDLNRH